MSSKCLLIALMALTLQCAYGQNGHKNRDRYQLYNSGADVDLENNGRLIKFFSTTSTTTTTTTTTVAPTTTTTTTPTTTPTTSPTITGRVTEFRSLDGTPFENDDDETEIGEFDDGDLVSPGADDYYDEPDDNLLTKPQNTQQVSNARAASDTNNCQEKVRRLQETIRRNAANWKRADRERRRRVMRRRQQQLRVRNEQKRIEEALRRRRRRRREWYNLATAERQFGLENHPNGAGRQYGPARNFRARTGQERFSRIERVFPN